jgi:hypothetical protein
VAVVAVLGASVGWVLGERAARQLEAEGKVKEALAAAEPGLRQGNPWDHELVAAAQRAAAQLDGGLLGPESRRRAEQLQKDVRMLAELERLRLDQAVGVRDNHYDSSGSGRQYATAFRDYGIDVEVLEPEKAAALVRGSAIRERLAAALDDWAASLSLESGSGDKENWRRPLAVARAGDPDAWRDRLREAMHDKVVSKQLIRSAPIEELSAAALEMLG